MIRKKSYVCFHNKFNFEFSKLKIWALKLWKIQICSTTNYYTLHAGRGFLLVR